MGRGKPLSDLELERIKILAAGGMSENQISLKLNRSRTLVKNALANHGKEAAITKAAFQEDQIQDYTDIIHTGLTKLKQKVEKDEMSAVALAKVVGIIFDKRQLVKGEPTQIEESNVTQNESREAESVVAAFAEFATQLGSGSSEESSGTTPYVVRPTLSEPLADNQDE